MFDRQQHCVDRQHGDIVARFRLAKVGQWAAAIEALRPVNRATVYEPSIAFVNPLEPGNWG